MSEERTYRGWGNLNTGTFMGTLTQDPKFSKAKDGNDAHDYAWCVLAINPNTRNKAAKPSFVPFKSFGAHAQNIAKYGKKGMGWAFIGHLQTDMRENSDGSRSYDMYVVVDQVVFGPESKKSKGTPVDQSQAQAPTKPAKAATSAASAAQEHLASLLGKLSSEDKTKLAASLLSEQAADMPLLSEPADLPL